MAYALALLGTGMDDKSDTWLALEAATRNVVVLLRLKPSGKSGYSKEPLPTTEGELAVDGALVASMEDADMDGGDSDDAPKPTSLRAPTLRVRVEPLTCAPSETEILCCSSIATAQAGHKRPGLKSKKAGAGHWEQRG